MQSVIPKITSMVDKLTIGKDSAPALKLPGLEELSALKKKYEDNSQGHVTTFWDSLTASEQAQLYNQLLTLDPARLKTIAKTVLAPETESPEETKLAPVPAEHVASTLDASAEQLADWRQKGLKAIAQGKVAVLLMAGGQGTRLGSSKPKGCFNIGLPSGKSLFQLQAERLVKLQGLAAKEHGNRVKESVIPWYIMTSGPTRKDTEEFLRSNNFFGLKAITPHIPH
jgi:UDP-N-acetylglucosamine/UDP-N-acetylgalactosamine diphosphorylase